jgi:RNA polymerase sigma-70 factor (ECF subfamily)
VESRRFKEIFDLYYEKVRSFAYYKTGNLSLSEDIVQDTFMKLWEKRENINEATVKPLVYVMAENSIKNHFKHKKAEFNFVLKTQFPGISEPADFRLEQEEFNRFLNLTLAEIPEKNRVVFLMNRIDKLTYSEIAACLDVSVKTIEKRMAEALEIIRKRIRYKI